jgi:cation transport ATPase
VKTELRSKIYTNRMTRKKESMSDVSQESSQDLGNNQPQSLSRFEERRQHREERRAARGSRFGGTWIGGVVLIVLGVIFLLQNLDIFLPGNWWALFILLPAIVAFGRAWRSYQMADSHLTASARGSIIAGLAFTMVSAFFLFDLNWTTLGPVLIILIGSGLLLNSVLPK